MDSSKCQTQLTTYQLNRGKLNASYGLIGMLVRAVDFLQLGVEPSASRMKVLMKPAVNISPAVDWVELESRRRTFWCIFLLDRSEGESYTRIL